MENVLIIEGIIGKIETKTFKNATVTNFSLSNNYENTSPPNL